MSGYFITGTDTGVGKTIICGAIAHALVLSGKHIGVMKPFETGCITRNGGLVPEDALFLKEMAQCREDISTICPCRFKHPLAPLVAASLEMASINIESVIKTYREMEKKYETILVEGAGGIMVPLDNDYVTLDLIRDLGLPLIIVSRLSLGTINHTLLTVTQARQYGIEIAGIIFNQLTQETGKAEETNPKIIQEFAQVPILGQVPFISRKKRSDAAFLAKVAESCIDLPRMFKP